MGGGDFRGPTPGKDKNTNPFGGKGHREKKEGGGGGGDGPNQKGISDRVGGTLELGCNPPSRKTLQNQTKGK